MAKLTLSSPHTYRRRPHLVPHRSMRLDASPPGRRRGWNEVARVLPGPLDIPSDVSGGRALSCGTSTYVRDLAHDAWLGSTRRRSSVRGPEEKFGGARNSRADRRSTRQEFFYCVTTRHFADRPRRRRRRALLSPTSLALRLGVFLATFGCRSPFTLPLGRLPSSQLAQTVGFAAVPLPPVPRLESPLAAFAQTGTPSQPSASGRDTGFRCMLDVSHGRLSLPLGQPGEDRNILLGHLPIRGLFLRNSPVRSGALRLTAQPQLRTTHEDRRRNTEGDEGRRTQKPSPSEARNQAQAKETGKETVQIRSGLKGNNEGDGQVKPCA